MAKSYGTKSEMEKDKPAFKPLKSGSYICKLIKCEVVEKKNYDGDVVPHLSLQFSPYEANARTTKMVDVDGATVKPLSRRLFQDMDKITMGFRENYTIASKYRALQAAFQGVDPNDDVLGPDELTAESAYDQTNEHFGEYLVVNVTVTEKNGKRKNKITDFQPVPEDFEADAVIEKQAEADAQKRADNPKSDRGGRAAESSDDEDDDTSLEEEDAPAKKSAKGKKPLF